MNKEKLTNKELSIIMSVYKEPLDWIAEAIDSILSQTFKDFEFIIINDNPSSTELSDILKNYKNKDSRITLLTNPQNIGLTKSLNIGLKHANGEFIARMDADDISKPTRFEKQINILKRNPNIGIIGCWTQYIGTKSGFAKYPKTDEELKALQLFSSPFDHPATMFRADIIIKNNISYDESLRYAQDQKFWYELSKQCDFACIPEVLFIHRYNNQQISKAHSKEQLENMHRVRKEMIADYLHTYDIIEDLDQLDVDSIKSIKNQLLSKNPNEELKISKIIMSLLFSLQTYNIQTFISFIFSNLYFTNGWKLKDVIRVLLKNLNPSMFPWAGIR